MGTQTKFEVTTEEATAVDQGDILEMELRVHRLVDHEYGYNDTYYDVEFSMNQDEEFEWSKTVGDGRTGEMDPGHVKATRTAAEYVDSHYEKDVDLGVLS